MTDPGDLGRHAGTTDLRGVLAVEQAAGLLHLSVKTLKRLAQTGDIPSRRVGYQWRFNCQTLVDWLAGKAVRH
jgi:excisionase family DNA binding protein